MFDAFFEKIRASTFFDVETPIYIARAPGRLDVMGGIADYSGSLVLQWPIAEATFAAIQRTAEPVVEMISNGSPPRTFSMNASDLEVGYVEARSFFAGEERSRWAAYVAGPLIVLGHEQGISFSSGAKIFISSDVPEGKGVASSAALEVAVMQAACRAFDINLEPQQIAVLCQKAENLVAGAPCGLMDQMTSACGEANSLLALLCQPAELQTSVRLPDGIRFWGVDSGERHAVSGSDYSSVRIGAFMGRRMIAELGRTFGDYLANIRGDEFERAFMYSLPEAMKGSEFITRFSGTGDTVTTVDPERTYKIRIPTSHPIYEHHRVQEFRELLLGRVNDKELQRLGELMYQSHASYSACGLGSRGTDMIVDLVRSAGPENGLYGARITGGGSGGTVAVIGRADAEPAIVEIARDYANATGHRPYVFSGSSPGAAHSGVVRLRLKGEC
jgi:galactokinase